MRFRLAAATVALCIATPAWAQDMVVSNDTGKTITQLEISPAGKDDWKTSKIDTEVKKLEDIKNGGKTTIFFDLPDGQCKMDFKASYTDKTTATWSGINVCDNWRVRLKASDFSYN